MTDIDLYSESAFAAVAESRFLSQEDTQALAKMREELQDNWEKRQIWRTETEMEFSVLNDVMHPTKASKYWQAVREQATFFEGLVMLSFQYRRHLIKLERLKKNLETAATDLDKQEAEIDIEEALYQKREMELASKDRMRELKLWSQIKAKLDDGTFDTQDVNAHQLEGYTQRFLAECDAVRKTGANLGNGEARNLMGHALTALRICEEKGILQQVLSGCGVADNVMPLLGFRKIGE